MLLRKTQAHTQGPVSTQGVVLPTAQALAPSLHSLVHEGPALADDGDLATHSLCVLISKVSSFHRSLVFRIGTLVWRKRTAQSSTISLAHCCAHASPFGVLQGCSTSEAGRWRQNAYRVRLNVCKAGAQNRLLTQAGLRERHANHVDNKRRVVYFIGGGKA